MRKLENIRQDSTVQNLKQSAASAIKGGNYIDLLDWSSPVDPGDSEKDKYNK